MDLRQLPYAFALLFALVALAACRREAPSGYVLTPRGWFHESCVRGVPKGGKVLPSGAVLFASGKLFSKGRRCEFPPLGIHDFQPLGAGGSSMGYDAEGSWFSREPVGSISAQVIVPEEPVSKGATLFLFFGIRPIGGRRILQPLLQYGASRLGGGDYWQLSTWDCCDQQNGGVIHYSHPVRVNPGDSVEASLIESCSGTDCSWVTTATVNGMVETPETFDLGARIDFVDKVGGALESYGVTDCFTSYPASGSVTFSGIVIRDRMGNTLTPTWGAWVNHDTTAGGDTCVFNVVPGFNSVTVEF